MVTEKKSNQKELSEINQTAPVRAGAIKTLKHKKMKRVKAPTTVEENLITYQETIFEVLEKAGSHILKSFMYVSPDLRTTEETNEIVNSISELVANLKRPEAWKTVNESYVLNNETPANPDRLTIAISVLQGLVSNYTLSNPEDQNTLTELSFELADNLIEKSKV